jgi:hypothetical protein
MLGITASHAGSLASAATTLLQVNGKSVSATHTANRTLIHLLRDDLCVTETKKAAVKELGVPARFFATVSACSRA